MPAADLRGVLAALLLAQNADSRAVADIKAIMRRRQREIDDLAERLEDARL